MVELEVAHTYYRKKALLNFARRSIEYNVILEISIEQRNMVDLDIDVHFKKELIKDTRIVSLYLSNLRSCGAHCIGTVFNTNLNEVLSCLIKSTEEIEFLEFDSLDMPIYYPEIEEEEEED